MAYQKNFYFPVIGQTEWSGGSWMPDTKNHRGRTHAAIDIYAERGSAIVAPVSGVIHDVKTGDIGGHTVRLLGDDGQMYYFAHMDSASPAIKGSRVNIGTYLGAVGNSGSAKSTKPHVHFSVRDHRTNDVIDPRNLLRNAYVIPESAYDAGLPNPEPIDQGYVIQGNIGYVDPFDVAFNAMQDGDDEPPKDNAQFSAQEFLAYSMDAMSSLVTNGAARADFSMLGEANVPRNQVRLKKSIDTHEMEGEDA